MTSAQLRGRFACTYCLKPFERRANLVRHLLCPSMFGEHSEFYQLEANRRGLITRSGVDFRSVVDPESEKANDVEDVSTCVDEAAEASNPAEILQSFLPALNHREARLAARVFSLVARRFSREALELEKLNKVSKEYPGAACRRRCIRSRFRRFRNDLDDDTVLVESDSTTSFSTEGSTTPHSQTITINDTMSDVEPDSSPCTSTPRRAPLKPLNCHYSDISFDEV